MTLLKPKQVDRILQWPFGKTTRLAKQGKFPHILLPDGQIRFAPKDIDYLLEKWRKGEIEKADEQIDNRQPVGAV